MGIGFMLVYFVIVFLVLRISTHLLVMTGLEPSVASFQVVSMLTGTGFTTTESELVLRHPVRRRLALFLILFGAFSLAVVISSLSAILSNQTDLTQLTAVAAVLAAVLLIVRNKRVHERLSRILMKRINRRSEFDPMPVSELASEWRDEMVMGVQLADDSSWVGRSLKDVLTEDEDILPLLIKRGDKRMRKERWDVLLQEGDFVLLYGNQRQIEQKCRNERVGRKGAGTELSE